jgi:hypothetical protein
LVLDYIFAEQQGIKHWRYFVVYNEHVEEETPSQCSCKNERLYVYKMYYVPITKGFNIKIGK